MTQPRHFTALMLTVLSLPLAACFSTGDKSGDEAPSLALRPGVAHVYRAERTEFVEGSRPDQRVYSSARVGDLVREGDRFYMVYSIFTGGTSGVTDVILTSDDLGASWAKHPMPLIHSDLAGLQVSGGKVSVAIYGKSEGLGIPYDLMVDADLSTREYTSRLDDQSRRLFGGAFNAGRTVVSYVINYAHFGEGPGNLNYYVYNPKTPPVTNLFAPSVAPKDYCIPTISRDGAVFSGLCNMGPEAGEAGVITRVCQASAAPGAGRLVPDFGPCVLLTSWPADVEPLELGTWADRSRWTPRGPAVLQAASGRVNAVLYDDRITPHALELYDLGPGVVELDRARLSRRFDGLVPVVAEDGERRLLEIAADGQLFEVTFPRTPCVNDSECGHSSSVEYLFTLGDGTALAVYEVDTVEQNQGAQKNLFVSRVELQRRSPQVLPMRRLEGRTPLEELATPASALEQTCALAQSCTGWNSDTQQGITLDACLDFWTERAWGRGLERRARFLAASTCHELVVAWPEAMVPRYCGTYELWEGCHEELMIKCNGGLISSWMDCGANGGTCSWMAGSQLSCVAPEQPIPSEECGTCAADGRAVHCQAFPAGTKRYLDCPGMGKVCVPGAETATCAGPTCGGPSHVCTGDILRACEGGVATDPSRTCGVYETTCDEAAGACVTLRQDPICATDPSFVSCKGLRAYYCQGSELREVACPGACATGMKGSTPITICFQ